MSSPYWIVNKTGLPLLFKQEGSNTLAAGQSVEHELARLIPPLMFSFADNYGNTEISARVGQKLHENGAPQVINKPKFKGFIIKKLF